MSINEMSLRELLFTIVFLPLLIAVLIGNVCVFALKVLAEKLL